MSKFGRKQAETAAQYLAKGRSVMLEGRLKMDSWDDKTTGKKVYKMKVVAERLQFVGGGGQGGAPAAGGAPRAATAPRPLPPRPAPAQAYAPPQQGGDEGGGPDFDSGPPAEDLNIPEENIPF